jgi:DNA-binding MarR family transcriptional regulator
MGLFVETKKLSLDNITSISYYLISNNMISKFYKNILHGENRMMKQKLIDWIGHYLEKLPDIDAGLVLDAISLLTLQHELELLSEVLHSRLGLNARQMETLEALFHHPDRTLTPAQLTDVVPLTRSAMTSNLDSLERKGYLSRSSHKGDRRMIAVTLTEKGIKFCEEKLPVRYHDMAMVAGILSPDERRLLYDAYNRIAEFIKQALREDRIDFIKTNPAKT